MAIIKKNINKHRKGNHTQNERKPTKWEKIFANDVTDRGVKFPKYRNSSYNSISKNTRPNQKQGTISKKTFF